MADLNLRNVPVELVAKLKMRALQSRQTLRDYCLGILDNVSIVTSVDDVTGVSRVNMAGSLGSVKRNPGEVVEVEIEEIPTRMVPKREGDYETEEVISAFKADRQENRQAGTEDGKALHEVEAVRSSQTGLTRLSGEPVNKEPYRPEPRVVRHTPKEFGFDEASFTDAATVEAHGGKVPLMRMITVDSSAGVDTEFVEYIAPLEPPAGFGKVITHPEEVGRVVGALKGGKGVSGEGAKGGGGAAVPVPKNDGGVTGGDGQDHGAGGGVVFPGESDTEAVAGKARGFPVPRCPKCRTEMTDEGEFFVCKNLKCRQKPISVDEVRERYEREQGE